MVIGTSLQLQEVGEKGMKGGRRERDEEGMQRFQSRLQLRGMRITSFFHRSLSLKGFSKVSEFSELSLLQKCDSIQLHQC